MICEFSIVPLFSSEFVASLTPSKITNNKHHKHINKSSYYNRIAYFVQLIFKSEGNVVIEA